jgi:hypothetical protein
MTFEEILDQAMALLQRRGRVTYRMLKVQFQLSDEQLEALKEELIYGQQLAVDEEGKVLVWAERAAAAAPPERDRTPVPASYTPPSRGEDPHLYSRLRRRAQAGHRPVRGLEGLHGVIGRPRPGGGAPAP